MYEYEFVFPLVAGNQSSRQLTALVGRGFRIHSVQSDYILLSKYTPPPGELERVPLGVRLTRWFR